MSEASGPGPASAFDSVSQGPSAGTLLRRAREAAGLHVDSLAASLKVPVRKLEALEADRFDLLPDAVFARALAASVCRTLKLDPAPVLQRLPATDRRSLAPAGREINAPFSAPGDRGAGARWAEQLSRPVFLVVFALLLGALVLILLPQRREEVATVRQETSVPQTAPAPATAPAADPGALKAASAGGTVSDGAPAFVASEPPPVAVAATQAAAGGIVAFRARSASWVQVTDANGDVPLRKLLAAGESASASGALPLTVTVGSAAATEVQVRGKPLDLAPLTRGGVARFEVK